MSINPIEKLSSLSTATKAALVTFHCSLGVITLYSPEDEENNSLITNIAIQTLLSSIASLSLREEARKKEILIAGPIVYTAFGTMNKLTGAALQMISPLNLSKIIRMVDDTAFTSGGIVSISAIVTRILARLEETSARPIIGRLKTFLKQPSLQNRTLQVTGIWFFIRNHIPPFNLPLLRHTSAVLAGVEAVPALKNLQAPSTQVAERNHEAAAKTVSWELAIRLILCAWTVYLVCSDLFDSDKA